MDVLEAEVDVSADAQHGLDVQRAAHVVGIGFGGGQTEAKPAHQNRMRGDSQPGKDIFT